VHAQVLHVCFPPPVPLHMPHFPVVNPVPPHFEHFLAFLTTVFSGPSTGSLPGRISARAIAPLTRSTAAATIIKRFISSPPLSADHFFLGFGLGLD
jgi:hypothetical protein